MSQAQGWPAQDISVLDTVLIRRDKPNLNVSICLITQFHSDGTVGDVELVLYTCKSMNKYISV
jgi:hypothetical protein